MKLRKPRTAGERFLLTIWIAAIVGLGATLGARATNGWLSFALWVPAVLAVIYVSALVGLSVGIVAADLDEDEDELRGQS